VNGYNNGGSGVNANNCSSANGFAPTSLASGYPIVDVSQIQAASYCSSIGAHLITNNEWQTIAWNAESQGVNWNGGVVGTNFIYSGHNDNNPANALVASADDTDGYNGTLNTAPSNQKRTLVLSNGSIIWDMAGNLWQWTNDTITGTNQPYGGTAGFAWREFTAITSWGTMTQSTAGPSNNTWNSGKGIGQIYSDGSSNATIYGFIRGGYWGNGGYDGVEALYLHITPGNSTTYIGFRCAR
jgi:formylglycine-generating enzyme required for sulfatase activity